MLYEKIKKLCEENNISINSLESELGFSNGSVIKWKTSIPSVTKMKKVADYFGTTIDELLRK